jgi:hypothetical protein
MHLSNVPIKMRTASKFHVVDDPVARSVLVVVNANWADSKVADSKSEAAIFVAARSD